jgi:8-oxo-dGTP diphosphatase
VKKPKSGVKAVIIRDGKLLAVKKRASGKTFYSFPGGKQEIGETLVQAVTREFLEEAGQEIEVEELLFVREFIARNHPEVAGNGSHTVDHLFLCRLKNPTATITEGEKPDKGQIGFEWLNVADLEKQHFFPRQLVGCLQQIAQGKHPGKFYLGDIN